VSIVFKGRIELNMRASKFSRRMAPVIVGAAAALSAAPAALADTGAHSQGGQSAPGAVYTETNAAAGNSLLVFYRGRDGALTPGGSYATGGTGTGTGLGSGHSVVASSSGREVLAVNAGSNTVSAFGLGHEGLRQLGQAAPSGGTTPTSVTVAGRIVYVMNAGSGTISGFYLDGRAGLLPIPGSTLPLAASGTAADSQIQFDQTGHVLIVDERSVNLIQTFVVGRDGVARPAQTTTSSAGGPFGFDVDRQNHVLFSDVAVGTSSGASSYDVSRDGTLQENGAPVTSGQAAACWLAAVGRYAYTDNAGSGSIGRFAVSPNGQLSLTGTTQISPTAHPLDMAGAQGHYLYVLANGLNEIIGYQVAADGSLTQTTSVPVPAGVSGVGAY
jgi:6-phosphogluconolactonase